MTTDAAALLPYGWDGRVEAGLAAAGGGAAGGRAVPGRVVRVEKGGSFVRTAGGEWLAASDAGVAVGDWVLVEDDGGTVLVRHVVERWSGLARHDPETGARQVLAANVDLVIVVAPLDRLHLARVERELLLAWDSGARPLVALTKADLATDPERARDDVEGRVNEEAVVLTSTVTGAGIDEIARRLQPNLTAVLFGPSGAGKSSLANALLGGAVLATGDVRDADRRGRHTTTSRHLVPVPGGGVLIDTPGLRSLSIWQAEEGISAAFSELEQLAEGCRFRDCRHESEPGCAITTAVEAGTVDVRRVASYLKLLRELEDDGPQPSRPGPSARRRHRGR